MNIAVFIKRTTFHKGYGGMETQNKLVCEGLVKRGHKVTVFSPKWDLENSTENESNVKYYFVDCVYRMGPVFGFFGTLQKNNWINRSYIEFLKVHEEERFDLVLAQSSTGLGLIRKKRTLGVPVISIAHGSIIGEYKTFLATLSFPKDIILFVKNTGFTLKNFFRRQRNFVNGSDKVIAVSNYVRNALLEETFTNDDRIVVIPNGIDPEPFNNIASDIVRGKKLLYVGQIIKPKGVEELVTMLEDVRFSGYKLDIVGGGDLLDTLKARIEKSPELRERVKMLGKQPFTQLIDRYYANSEYGAFVFPTNRAEGLPMVLVEAMFSGLPVVVYNNGGVSDAVFDGETGYVVSAGDFEAFKLRTLELLESQELRNKMSTQSLIKAHNSFTLKVMLDAYEKVFEEVLT